MNKYLISNFFTSKNDSQMNMNEDTLLEIKSLPIQNLKVKNEIILGKKLYTFFQFISFKCLEFCLNSIINFNTVKFL